MGVRLSSEPGTRVLSKASTDYSGHLQVQRMHAAQRRYLSEHARVLLLQYAHDELRKEERIVFRGQHFVAAYGHKN